MCRFSRLLVGWAPCIVMPAPCGCLHPLRFPGLDGLPFPNGGLPWRTLQFPLNHPHDNPPSAPIYPPAQPVPWFSVHQISWGMMPPSRCDDLMHNCCEGPLGASDGHGGHGPWWSSKIPWNHDKHRLSGDFGRYQLDQWTLLPPLWVKLCKF